jgi:hypothetical protein
MRRKVNERIMGRSDCGRSGLALQPQPTIMGATKRTPKRSRQQKSSTNAPAPNQELCCGQDGCPLKGTHQTRVHDTKALF